MGTVAPANTLASCLQRRDAVHHLVRMFSCNRHHKLCRRTIVININVNTNWHSTLKNWHSTINWPRGPREYKNAATPCASVSCQTSRAKSRDTGRIVRDSGPFRARFLSGRCVCVYCLPPCAHPPVPREGRARGRARARERAARIEACDTISHASCHVYIPMMRMLHVFAGIVRVREILGRTPESCEISH